MRPMDFELVQLRFSSFSHHLRGRESSFRVMHETDTWNMFQNNIWPEVTTDIAITRNSSKGIGRTCHAHFVTSRLSCGDHGPSVSVFRGSGPVVRTIKPLHLYRCVPCQLVACPYRTKDQGFSIPLAALI